MSNILRRYNRFLSSIGIETLLHFDPRDKEQATTLHIDYLLNKVSSMFRWEGLPDTIPQRSLELYLMCNGFACIAEHNNNLYAFWGGLGGEPDPYYMPTQCIVANPALNLSKTYNINKDCVIVPNDTMYRGLLPLFTKHAKSFTETELSIFLATINTRIISLISAQDDRTRESAEKYLMDVESGRVGVVAESAFLEGLKAQPLATTSGGRDITSLIELIQYQKASLYNEIGLNANYNMKRESINSGESQLNNDVLFPLVDDMRKQREEGAKRINEMFGTNITVSLASSWEDNEKEVELVQKQLETPATISEKIEGGENNDKEENK